MMHTNPCRSRRLAALALAFGVALLAAPASRAGEFTINACQADAGGFSSGAFEDFATRGMRWRRACSPEGSGLRGMVTSNVVRAGRVGRGARSVFVMRAPDGTRFLRLSWSGQARRRDCRYALQLYATRPDGPPVAIKNVRANERCPRRGRGQAAGWPRPRDYDIAGATQIVQRVVCVGAARDRACSARGLNYIRTFKAQATVQDDSAPAVTVLQDNPFTRGEWSAGAQTVTYDAADNVGIKLARTVVGAVARGEHTRACDYTQRVPCTNGQGTINIATDRISEGSQELRVQAEDAASNGGTSEGITVRVDNTPPGAVAVSVAGGEEWRNTNDFDLAWENPPEPDRAPIAAAHYRLCRAGTNDCTSDSRQSADIRRIDDLGVPAAGDWELRLWRRDAAGNAAEGNASVPVRLRYDPEAPQLGFEPQDGADPTRVSVLVTDSHSGLSDGQVEISQQGSGSWQALATQREGDRLVARVDDAGLPAGTYLLRASARDQAGNQNLSDRRLDGEPMVLTLPLRIATSLTAGVVDTRTVRRTVRRRGKRRTVRRRETVLRPRARVAFGRRVQIAGVLTNRDGQPIPGAEIRVLSRTPTTGEQLVGVAQTDANGRYSYTAEGSTTRTLRLVYAGTGVTLPSQQEVTLLVPASSTLRASRRRAANGQSVTFRGRLRTLPAGAPGKLVELQVRLSGGWHTFRTTRTNPEGGWSVRYRFRRTCGTQRWHFRAGLPAEAGYPFEAGGSRAISIRVRGKPCR